MVTAIQQPPALVSTRCSYVCEHLGTTLDSAAVGGCAKSLETSRLTKQGGD